MKEQLYDLYVNQGLSMRIIAEKLGCTRGKVRPLLLKYGIKSRTKSEALKLAFEKGRIDRVGENNSNWKGGISKRGVKYGINQEIYDEMIKEQDNKCAICHNEFEDTPNIDHCHETNKVRGLLCSPCNRGLGFFRDNSEALKRAANYLNS